MLLQLKNIKSPMEKNIKVGPINSTLKNEIMSYCDELHFGTISFILILKYYFFLL